MSDILVHTPFLHFYDISIFHQSSVSLGRPRLETDSVRTLDSRVNFSHLCVLKPCTWSEGAMFGADMGVQ